MLNTKVSNSFKEDTLAHINLIEKVPYDVNSDRVVMAADIVDNELVGYEVVAEEDYFVVRQLGGAVVDSSNTLKGALIKSADLTYAALAKAQEELDDVERVKLSTRLMNLLFSKGERPIRLEYVEELDTIEVGRIDRGDGTFSSIFVQVDEYHYSSESKGGYLSVERLHLDSKTESRAALYQDVIQALNDAVEVYRYQA